MKGLAAGKCVWVQQWALAFVWALLVMRLLLLTAFFRGPVGQRNCWSVHAAAQTVPDCPWLYQRSCQWWVCWSQTPNRRESCPWYCSGLAVLVCSRLSAVDLLWRLPPSWSSLAAL